MDKQLLQTRLSIVMIREKMNFLSSIQEFQSQLKRYFKYNYTLDEIENGLYELEESFICNEADKEKEIKILELANLKES